jgi:hypothetical protein
MMQIYINTNLGTKRIDYDPTDLRDIIIYALTCDIREVVYEHIESTDILPESIELIKIVK